MVKKMTAIQTTDVRISVPQITLLIDYQDFNDGFAEHAEKIVSFVRERGRLCIAKAYGNWSCIEQEKTWLLSQASLELVSLHYPSGVSSDASNIRLTIDAVEIAATYPSIDTFVLVASDATAFLPLVQKLRSQSKYAYVVQDDVHTYASIAGYCDEYVPLHRILGAKASIAPDSIDKFTLARRSLSLLACEGWISLDELRVRMLQLDPAFHESQFGFQSFGAYALDAEQAGILETQRGDGRRILIRSKDIKTDEIRSQSNDHT